MIILSYLCCIVFIICLILLMRSVANDCYVNLCEYQQNLIIIMCVCVLVMLIRFLLF